MTRSEFSGSSYAHGARVRYVSGCRCDACRAANTRYYRDRMRQRNEQAAEVTPSGPPLEGVAQRECRNIRIKRCPGANGSVCVRAKPTWLRGQGLVCSACVERATVWNGLVSPMRARKHLLQLRAAGIGYKAVAAASDVASSVLGRVLSGEGTIRSSTERRILQIDEAAIADHATIDAGSMNESIAQLRAQGFTLRQLGHLLGYKPRSVLQLGARARAWAGTAAKVERLARMAERGQVVPDRALVDAPEERAWLEGLLERGASPAWLSQRLGFVVARGDSTRMRRDNRAAVLELRAECERLAREGDGLPDDWQAPEGAGLRFAKGFGYAGGWLIRGNAKLPRTRRTKGAKTRPTLELVK